ncbi:hypothetical protein [Pedobacter ginsengisoli]|uniref:hypothetical protein n=1 Tax=Pedobacter ginsengisoli TaxID=363852 RepID=UPI00254C3B28|nr:hypothetical protein [Pedobacter ginsengisoli]
MNALSPWAISASAELAGDIPAVFEHTAGQFHFKVTATSDSIWIQTELPGGGHVAFRAAYSPGSDLEITKINNNKQQEVDLDLSSAIGSQKVRITVDETQQSPVLRYTNSLTPVKDMLISGWPKDILFNGKNNNPEQTAGKIHAGQFGIRTGFMYLTQTRPKSATLLYLQNLTALSDYCEQTETSLGDTVAGEWPELGFSLPASKKPLKADKAVILNDAFIAFDQEIPNDEPAVMRLYLDLLARIYLLLPLPATKYQQWPDILKKGLKDLISSPGCWSQVNGHHYFNAYVCDYKTPPEIMVQLAVLLPLLDYVEWSGEDMEVMKVIKNGLSSFYNKEIGSIVRWLPAAEHELEGEEEQKLPMVMDSWYLHHPLLNLSRLALKGDKTARQLFLDSLEFTIKVAHHFKYKWPVFYKMDTLEVIKAETAPGKGGEKDVAGIYAHVMLQAWELTKEKRYLNEAEKAAKTLSGFGFDVFYQANNTAFSSGALLRLYKITNNKLYLDLSYMCLAAIFRNAQLWDCNYGYGKYFQTFFSVFPLNDAPYTAVYEEQEVFCAFHDYLKHAEDIDLLPSARLLMAEYIRCLIARAAYYYPTMLPKEMLEEQPKVGELDPNLWIALEDLHDGWEKSGAVGQEVYGAGNAFGILPRHYIRVAAKDLLVYLDYPTKLISGRKDKSLSFKILGDGRLNCEMRIGKTTGDKLPHVLVRAKGVKNPIEGKLTDNGQLKYILSGDQQISISWD